MSAAGPDGQLAQLDETAERLRQAALAADLPAVGDEARVDAFLVDAHRAAWDAAPLSTT